MHFVLKNPFQLALSGILVGVQFDLINCLLVPHALVHGRLCHPCRLKHPLLVQSRDAQEEAENAAGAFLEYLDELKKDRKDFLELSQSDSLSPATANSTGTRSLTKAAGTTNSSFIDRYNEELPPNPQEGDEENVVPKIINSPTADTSNTNPRSSMYEVDSILKFEQDIATVLKKQRSEGFDPSLPKLFRNIKMPSFTNIWSQKDWDFHTSRWRYFKYLLALPTSRLLKRLAPQLCILVLWSCMACWMCSKEFEGILSRAVLPLTPLGLVSTFIAGLLTLRSNQGLSRLNEGRLAFGKVVLYTREMGQLIATVVYPKNPQLAMLAARHVSLFGWLLKDFLRHYDEDYTRPLDPYNASLCYEEDIVRTVLPHRYGCQNNDANETSINAQFILDQRKKPVAICTRLRQMFAILRSELTSSEQSRLDSCAQQLNKCVLVCERIRASPIPPLYTAHAGRLLIFYLFFLPLALRGSSLLNNVGTILTTTVVGYAMLGLDEISHILEEPFRLMPLYHLAKNSMKDVADAIVCMPPPLPQHITRQHRSEVNTPSEEDYFLLPPKSGHVPDYW